MSKNYQYFPRSRSRCAKSKLVGWNSDLSALPLFLRIASGALNEATGSAGIHVIVFRYKLGSNYLLAGVKFFTPAVSAAVPMHGAARIAGPVPTMS